MLQLLEELWNSPRNCSVVVCDWNHISVSGTESRVRYWDWSHRFWIYCLCCNSLRDFGRNWLENDLEKLFSGSENPAISARPTSTIMKMIHINLDDFLIQVLYHFFWRIEYWIIFGICIWHQLAHKDFKKVCLTARRKKNMNKLKWICLVKYSHLWQLSAKLLNWVQI